MEEEQQYWGVTRIRNPKTLQKWINKGWYKSSIDRGFIFSIGCGRFRNHICQCTKCKKTVNSPLKHILIKNNLL